MKSLYTKIDLAENLSLSIGTIDNHMKTGNLKYLKIGKAVRFTDKDIDAWLLKHYTLKYISNSIDEEKVNSIKASILGE